MLSRLPILRAASAGHFLKTTAFFGARWLSCD